MLSIIAALDRNRVIGRGGRMAWHIPGEQRRFRELTLGGAVILGRTSWQEISRPLPGRRTIVLSRDPAFVAPGCLVARSLEEAISLAGNLEVWIAGGASVYAQALPLAQRLCLTEIDAAYPGDAFFPEFDESAYTKSLDFVLEGDPLCRFYTYRRIRH